VEAHRAFVETEFVQQLKTQEDVRRERGVPPPTDTGERGIMLDGRPTAGAQP
jgi:hypothetical protein